MPGAARRWRAPRSSARSSTIERTGRTRPCNRGRWRSPKVFLLPNYDELFIGHKDRSAIGRRLESAELVTGGDALNAYVVAVDGQLVGGWKRTLTRGSVVIELRLLTRLSPAERRALDVAAQRHGEFLDLPVARRR